jgi:uncharacterized protein YggT (Ycf19 family)
VTTAGIALLAAFWKAIDKLLAWFFASNLSSWSSPKAMEDRIAIATKHLGNAEIAIFR